MSLTNAQLAELLALRAEEVEGPDRIRAYRSASRAAFTWPEEASNIVAQGRSLTELQRIGARLEHVLQAWLDDPPEVPPPAPERAGFLTYTQVRATLARHPQYRDGLRGDLQMHTTGSDGRASVAEMAEVGVAYGYEYIAITDHSKGLRIAGGMHEDDFAAQALEIELVNERLGGDGAGLTVLNGIEMNLDPQGQGDMDQGFLAGRDLVLGSFHSALRRRSDQTERYLAALGNPQVDVLGHPRGRIYNRRFGLSADWDVVFAEAARNGTAIEIDAYPDRQDLDVELLRVALEAGVTFSIGTDAHNQAEMSVIDYALAAAALAGIPKDRILNFRSLQALSEWVELRRSE